MKDIKDKKAVLEKEIQKLVNEFVKEFPEITDLEIDTRNHYGGDSKLINVTAKISVKI